MWWKPIRRSMAGLALLAGAWLFAGAQNPQATTVSTLTPAAVAYDAAGNLYIAVRAENVVRKVDTLGAVTVVAGTGEQGFSGDNGPATAADLDSPSGVAVDAKGTLYIADSHNNRVRTVTAGVIQTLVGTGVAGYSGDGGSGQAAQLDGPTALSVDSAGNLYIADTFNQRIRRLSGGILTTFAGTGEQGYAGDGGAATAAQLDSPTGVGADPTMVGRVYIGDTHNERVRVVNASGVISTLAGTGAYAFSGDGASSVTAALATPKGLAVGANGTVYVADSANERVRAIAGGTIGTVAGDGEQGFAGDLGTPVAAILDTPWAVAVNASGVLALSDTHNERVRAVSGSSIYTVAGLPPTLTEGLVLSGPTSGTYGTPVGTLNAVFSNGANTATGSLTLFDGGNPIATAPLAGNTASFSLGALAGGLHTLAVSFAGDGADPAIASGVYLVDIAPAAQTLSFAPPATSLTYSPGLTEGLNAAASSGLPVSFTVTGPATVSGSTLTVTGPGTVTVTATQAGNGNYASISQTQQIVIKAAPVLAGSLSPGAVNLGASNVQLTITGSGFTGTSQIEINGTPIQTTYVSFTEVQATLTSVPTSLGNLAVTVVDPASQAVSGTLNLRVVAPLANLLLSAPTTSSSGQQPNISLQVATAYPAPLQGILTLQFTPSGNQAVSDPAVQFSTGPTYPFTIAANSTAPISIPLATGTLAGTVTVNLTVTAGGMDVTPTNRTATITIPAQVPQISGGHVSFTQSGANLTVTVVGFSNTRDMSQAIFTFTPAPGSSLATNSLTLPVSSLFTTWFGNSASFNSGSNFTYTQTFTLSDPTAVVSGVAVQLVNSVGTSAQAASQ